MTDEEFEAALRALITNADINQLSASIILQDIADEQRAELDEAA